MPVTWVWPVTRWVSHRLNPRSVKNVPSVMMKLGSPERTTMNPLRKPIPMAMISDSTSETITLNPLCTENSAQNIPVVPTITPVERSNSPPIISRATPSALSPYSADVST